MKAATILIMALVVALATAASPRAHAENAAPTKEEIRAEVPALDEFHHVIRTIWHDAWPNKDVKTLRELLPKVQEGAAAVSEAKLPGILREKQAAWDEGVKTLETVVAAYAGAAAGADDKALLDAAERLHAHYEAMVRIVRPALPELDAFHVVLYQLYHYDMPAGEVAAMRATISRLKEPMGAIEKARLPEWLKKSEKAFLEARGRLSESVEKLAKAAPSGDAKGLKPMIESVHDDYLAAVNVCD
ncbi:MAG TPA: hypothetical protein VI198_05965 [Candidatus Eisenbacteria bacterium]